jgi:uncharacterized protein (DUF302 family)
MEEDMSTHMLYLLGGLLVGMLVMGLIVWLTMPSLMLIKRRSKLSYDEALKAIDEKFQKKQDWRLLKINDYQESTASFGAMERVCSVNVCNPRYASKILMEDKNRGVTAFMPLAIGVFEDKDGGVFISKLNVGLLGMMFGGTIAKVMNLAGKDIDEVVGQMTAE